LTGLWALSPNTYCGGDSVLNKKEDPLLLKIIHIKGKYIQKPLTGLWALSPNTYCGGDSVLNKKEDPLLLKIIHIKGKYIQKPIYEKGMLEILDALKQWRPYLIGRNFKVKTNHDSLKYFLEQILYS